MTRRTLSNEVRALVTYVRQQIDPDWSIHTPGWPDEIEAALIDAVMSIRATYGGPDTGVRRVVQRWREHTGDTRLDDLARLAATDPLDLATILGNRQRLPGNTLKAEGIVAAAAALAEAGVKQAADLCADDDGPPGGCRHGRRARAADVGLPGRARGGRGSTSRPAGDPTDRPGRRPRRRRHPLDARADRRRDDAAREPGDVARRDLAGVATGRTVAVSRGEMHVAT